MPLTVFYGSVPPHQSTHQTGGTDAETGVVDANARVAVYNNGTLIGTRRAVNLIPAGGSSISIADNAGAERVDVTITASGGSGTVSPMRSSFAEVGLTTIAPSSRTAHFLSVRAKKVNSGDSGSIVAWLYETVSGVDTLRSGPYSAALTTSFASTTFSLPNADAAAISSYANLRVRLQAQADAGFDLSTQVSWVQLAAPA